MIGAQVGEVGNFLAYGWAPATLVAPLGSFSVVASAVLVDIYIYMCLFYVIYIYIRADLCVII